MPATSRKSKPSLPAPVLSARRHLATHGWTQADAAEALDVSPGHLNYVLRGRRQSATLLDRIRQLGQAKNPTW